MTTTDNPPLNAAMRRLGSALHATRGRSLFSADFVINLCLDTRRNIEEAADLAGIKLDTTPTIPPKKDEGDGGASVPAITTPPDEGPPPVAVSPPRQESK